MLFNGMKLTIKICKLFGEFVSVWYNIKMLFTKFILQSYYIRTQTIFVSQFKTTWEMIQFLKFIQLFINLIRIRLRRPHYSPILTFSLKKLVCLKNSSYKFGFTFYKFKHKLSTMMMVVIICCLMRI